MGHVGDLATAFVKVLDNDKASKQVYNISGERFVTFDGIAKACAAAAGAPEPELVCTDLACMQAWPPDLCWHVSPCVMIL